MDHRYLGSFVRSTRGGVVTATAGVVWESVAVAHNLSYLRETVSRLDWRALAAYLWHPSPLTLFGVGFAWVVMSLLLRKNSMEHAVVAPQPIEARHVAEGYPVDVPPNVVQLAESGHDVIIKDVVRTRTIVVRASHR